MAGYQLLTALGTASIWQHVHIGFTLTNMIFL